MSKCTNRQHLPFGQQLYNAKKKKHIDLTVVHALVAASSIHNILRPVLLAVTVAVKELKVKYHPPLITPAA